MGRIKRGTSWTAEGERCMQEIIASSAIMKNLQNMQELPRGSTMPAHWPCMHARLWSFRGMD
jgi:hypothetical protein